MRAVRVRVRVVRTGAGKHRPAYESYPFLHIDTTGHTATAIPVSRARPVASMGQIQLGFQLLLPCTSTSQLQLLQNVHTGMNVHESGLWFCNFRASGDVGVPCSLRCSRCHRHSGQTPANNCHEILDWHCENKNAISIGSPKDGWTATTMNDVPMDGDA